MDYHKKFFERVLINETEIKQFKKKGFEISFPFNSKKLTSCEFYDKVSINSNFDTLIQYSNTVQVLENSKTIPKEIKNGLIDQMQKMDLSSYIMEDLVNLKSLESDCNKIIDSNSLLENVNGFLKKASDTKIMTKLYSMLKLRDIISNAFSIIGSITTAVLTQKSNNKYSQLMQKIMKYESLFIDFYKIYTFRKKEFSKVERQFWNEKRLEISETIRSL